MYGYNNCGGQQLLRVNGIESAKSFQLMPGSTVALFDANDDIFYVKSVDNAGFPSIRTFKFEEVSPTQMSGTSDFVSRKEMEDYVKQFISSATEAGSQTNG